MEVDQLDIKTSSLHGDLDVKILMEQQEAFEIQHKHKTCFYFLFYFYQEVSIWSKAITKAMVIPPWSKLASLEANLTIVCRGGQKSIWVDQTDRTEVVRFGSI